MLLICQYDPSFKYCESTSKLKDKKIENKKLVVVMAHTILIYEYEINDYLNYSRNSGITIVMQQIQL
jgi:hypothetical protein